MTQRVLVGKGADVAGPRVDCPQSLYRASAVPGRFACISSVCFNPEYLPSTLENIHILQLKYNTAGLLNDLKPSSPPSE